MNKIYQAPWGKALKVISGLVVLLALVLPVVIPAGGWGISKWIAPLVVLGCLPFVVRGYEITEDAILIRRLLWKTRLERGDLVSVEVVPRAMKGCLRTCGNGGGFSFTGWYWSRSLGTFHAYVTDFDKTVVLRFGKRTAVVSPERPEEFVMELGMGDGKVAETGDRRYGGDFQ